MATVPVHALALLGMTILAALSSVAHSQPLRPFLRTPTVDVPKHPVVKLRSPSPPLHSPVNATPNRLVSPRTPSSPFTEPARSPPPAGAPPTTGSDLFPLTPTDKTILDLLCSGEENNANFHPCPVTGACSFTNATCAPKDPQSCRTLAEMGSDQCTTPYGCGSPEIIKFPKVDITSCNAKQGFATSQSTHYCAARSANATQCSALCNQYTTGGVPGNSSFSCQSWVLVNPNLGTESTECTTGNGWVDQAGENQAVVTPYYGGCGWCFLLPQGECSPTCSAYGLNTVLGDNNNNIYWALYGRPTCSYGQDDPHFMGADGARFEFNGLLDQSFCLLSDNDVHINMKMHGYWDDRTVGASVVKNGKALRSWMRELGIMWRKADKNGKMQKHSLYLAARSGPKKERGAEGFLANAELNGRPLPRMAPGDQRTSRSGLTLTFVGVKQRGKFDVEVYHVSIDSLLNIVLKLRVAHPLLQTPKDAEVHFNVMIDSLNPTRSIHGILGQTYRAGRGVRALKYNSLAALLGHPVAADGDSGKGYLDGTMQDYHSSSVLSPDCKFSTFKRAGTLQGNRRV